MDHTISHYRVLEALGSGAAGHVWKAEDLRLKRTVAIKVLTAELAGDAEANERMRAEAQIAAGLSHPNIDSVPFLVFLRHLVEGLGRHLVEAVAPESAVPSVQANRSVVPSRNQLLAIRRESD
jgi:serine/threonine protein kinase